MGGRAGAHSLPGGSADAHERRKEVRRIPSEHSKHAPVTQRDHFALVEAVPEPVSVPEPVVVNRASVR